MTDDRENVAAGSGLMAADALAGVRIIDLSQVAAGPYATSLLGDFGADVIKVEPVEGEPFRKVDDLYGPTDSGYFFGINRSKRAIALDLKSEQGREVLDHLLDEADVLMVSMRPAALARLGIGYEAMHVRFPRLVYCMVTAFGEDGPRAAQPGMDILVQAVGGIMGTTGEPGRPPVKVGPPVTDFATAYLACFGVLAALRVRDRSGVGQKVSVSLLDTAVSMLANFVTPYLKSLVPVRPAGGGHPQMVPYQAFATRMAGSSSPASPSSSGSGCAPPSTGPILPKTPRFSSNTRRLAHRAELEEILNAVFSGRPASEWEAVLIASGVPVAHINLLEDVLQDPQVLHNQMLISLEHPRYGSVPVVNNPVRLSCSPAAAARLSAGHRRADRSDTCRGGLVARRDCPPQSRRNSAMTVANRRLAALGGGAFCVYSGSQERIYGEN